MTPKQKSIDLYNKFYLTSTHPNSVKARRNAAKYWALKVADEIINDCKLRYDPSSINELHTYLKINLTYWLDVKTEIQKLDT
jgi:hypothetical protein